MTTQPTDERVEKVVEEFANQFIIKARFNPKEPMYGEENRRDVVKLQEWLRTTLHQELQKAREEERCRMIALYGEPHCNNLHHKKAHQHEFDEDCPVVAEILKAYQSELDQPTAK